MIGRLRGRIVSRQPPFLLLEVNGVGYELEAPLLKVSGVGGKMALGVLSGMTAEEFSQAVQAGDLAALTRLPGVGKKTAERLVVEMRDKIDKIGIQAPAVAGGISAATPLPAGADQDAVSALVALGYRPPEASRMVSKVFEQGMDTESIIKAALQGTVK